MRMRAFLIFNAKGRPVSVVFPVFSVFLFQPHPCLRHLRFFCLHVQIAFELGFATAPPPDLTSTSTSPTDTPPGTPVFNIAPLLHLLRMPLSHLVKVDIQAPPLPSGACSTAGSTTAAVAGGAAAAGTTPQLPPGLDGSCVRRREGPSNVKEGAPSDSGGCRWAAAKVTVCAFRSVPLQQMKYEGAHRRRVL